MTRPARALCVFYGAVALFLAWASVQQALYGAVWAVPVLVACAVAPIVAYTREADHADAQETARADAERAARLQERRRIRDVSDALGYACCDQWWTSGCTAHHSTCEHYQHHRRTA